MSRCQPRALLWARGAVEKVPSKLHPITIAMVFLHCHRLLSAASHQQAHIVCLHAPTRAHSKHELARGSRVRPAAKRREFVPKHQVFNVASAGVAGRGSDNRLCVVGLVCDRGHRSAAGATDHLHESTAVSHVLSRCAIVLLGRHHAHQQASQRHVLSAVPMRQSHHVARLVLCYAPDDRCILPRSIQVRAE
jgi:hypothetical protein